MPVVPDVYVMSATSSIESSTTGAGASGAVIVAWKSMVPSGNGRRAATSSGTRIVGSAGSRSA